MPDPHAGEPVSVKIKSDGTPLPDDTRLLAVRTRAELNRIPEATIVIGDGDVASGTYPITDGTLLKPGAAVVIEAGYGSEAGAAIFEGIVTGQRLRIGGDGEPRLEIRCHAGAFKLAIGRRSAVFADLTDGDAMTRLVSDAGLTATVPATSVTHGALVQHCCSDWDFIVARAEALGLLVRADGAKVEIVAPDFGQAAAAKVSCGIDVRRIDLEIEARGQHAQVASAAWNEADHKLEEVQKTAAATLAWGDLTGSTLAEVGGGGALALRTGAAVDASLLGKWAAGRALRAELARMRGTVVVGGWSAIRPGVVLEIDGVGTRFGGKPFVTGVVHRIEDGDWSTEAILGLGADTRCEGGGPEAPGAAGLVPASRGLQVGMVTKVHEDPEGAARIQVKLPLVGEDALVWARVASPYASDAFGFRFVPEIGDEVVLGFMNDDPTTPLVLGSLHGKKFPPSVANAEGNALKTIVTRSMLRIEFDDEKKKIVVETPAGNRVTLDDEGKAVRLEDQTGNKVTLDDKGITLDSPKDVTIKALGKVVVDATGNAEIGAKADLSLDGMNVKATAQVGFSAQGSAQAELKSSGQTAVKGSIVMIN